jgi:hypothetical protein
LDTLRSFAAAAEAVESCDTDTEQSGRVWAWQHGIGDGVQCGLVAWIRPVALQVEPE